MKAHQRKFSFALMILLSCFQVKYGLVPGWEKIQDDFPNYYVSAKLLSEHQDLSVLYHNESFNEKVKSYGLQPTGQFALYAPPNALILLPLSGLTPIIAKRVWLLFNVLLIFVCGFLIRKITRWNWVTSLNTLLISGFALANDLFLGQVYLFITSFMLMGILFYRAERNYISGSFLGMALAFKYISIVFVPSLFLLRKWKALLGIISGVLLLYLICFPFFGIELISYFFNHVFFSHLNGQLYEGRPYAIQYQSWDSLLNNLFVYNQNQNPHPFIHSTTIFYTLKYFILASVLLVLAWFFHQTYRRRNFFDITASLTLISLLIFEPGSATYHNLFLLLPFILILRLMLSVKSRLVFSYVALFFLIGFLPTWLNRYTLLNGNSGSHSDLVFIFSYHRLWLEMIFYLYSIYFLYHFVRDEHFQKLNNDQHKADESF